MDLGSRTESAFGRSELYKNWTPRPGGDSVVSLQYPQEILRSWAPTPKEIKKVPARFGLDTILPLPHHAIGSYGCCLAQPPDSRLKYCKQSTTTKLLSRRDVETCLNTDLNSQNRYIPTFPTLVSFSSPSPLPPTKEPKEKKQVSFAKYAKVCFVVCNPFPYLLSVGGRDTHQNLGDN